jgi:hypothetical protein
MEHEALRDFLYGLAQKASRYLTLPLLGAVFLGNLPFEPTR